MLELEDSCLVRNYALSQQRETPHPPPINFYMKPEVILQILPHIEEFSKLCLNGRQKLLNPVAISHWPKALGETYGSLYELATILMLQGTRRSTGVVLDREKTFDLFQNFYPGSIPVDHGLGLKSLYLKGEDGEKIKVTPPDTLRVVITKHTCFIPTAYECSMVEDPSYYLYKAERYLDRLQEERSLLSDAQCCFVGVSNLKTISIKKELHHLGVKKGVPNAEKLFDFITVPFDHRSFKDFCKRILFEKEVMDDGYKVPFSKIKSPKKYYNNSQSYQSQNRLH